MRDAPKVKLGTLYEKTSKAGRRYFVGRLGAARILLFSTGEATEDGTPIWELLAEQAEERRPNGHAQQRGTDSLRQDGAIPGFLPGLSPENGRTVRSARQPRRVPISRARR